MRLNDKQKRILRLIQLNPNLSIQEISDKIGLSVRSVRYCKLDLEKNASIVKSVFFNPAHFGYLSYLLIISSSRLTTKDKNIFIAELRNSPFVGFFAETGGSSQFHCNLHVRSLKELTLFMSRIEEKFGASLGEKTLCVEKSCTLFGTKNLAPEIQSEPLTMDFDDPPHQPAADIIDRQIITTMSNVGCASRNIISKNLPSRLPGTTIDYRIKLMEKRGSIMGYYYFLEPAKLDMIPFSLFLRFSGLTQEMRTRLYRYAQSNEHIDVLISLYGEWDFMLGAPAHRYEDIVDLSNSLQAEFAPYLTRIQISMHRWVHKRCLDLVAPQ